MTNNQQLQVSQLRGMLSAPAMMEQLKTALPRHLTPERMVRVAMTAIQKVPKLMECSQQSIIGSVVEASQLGLEPDGVTGMAYLVPFYNKHTRSQECQLMVGYKGLLDLARRSGQVRTISAEIVYEADKFEFAKGLEPTLKHVPSWDLSEGDRGGMRAVYAVAELMDGGKQFVVLSAAEVEKFRKRSRAKDSGPWVTDREWMWKKTALRQLCKLLPFSIEMATALSKEELLDAGLPVSDDALKIEPAEKPESLSDLTEKIQGENANAEPVECDAEPLDSHVDSIDLLDDVPFEDIG